MSISWRKRACRRSRFCCWWWIACLCGDTGLALGCCCINLT